MSKQSLKVQQIMTQDVLAVRPITQLGRVFEIMRENRIRHLPVTDDHGNLEGLISHRDLLAASASYLTTGFEKSQKNILEKVTAATLMNKGVQTTTPDADVREVALAMRKHKWGCLPVLQDKRLVGIVTATDFVTLSINLLGLK